VAAAAGGDVSAKSWPGVARFGGRASIAI